MSDGTRIRLDESETNDDPVFLALVKLTQASDAYRSEVLHNWQPEEYEAWSEAIEKAKALLGKQGA